jgi:hypothetical protein
MNALKFDFGHFRCSFDLCVFMHMYLTLFGYVFSIVAWLSGRNIMAVFHLSQPYILYSFHCTSVVDANIVPRIYCNFPT